jgi:cytochrome c oxidase assembly factor CtaG
LASARSPITPCQGLDVTGAAGAYTWDPHPIAWGGLIVAAGLVIVGHRRLLRTMERPIVWTQRQIACSLGACGCLLVALTWPVADLAAHWALTALVIQRMILILAVAPLLLLGLPYDVLLWLTRSSFVDGLLVRLKRPPVAIVTVTVILVACMTPFMVRAQSNSAVVRALIDLVMVITGLVLWIPVLGRVPGILRLKPVVRFGYLVAQAVIPAFLSFILIFSIHPLYSVYAHSHAAIGLRPLNDQQIAGFVSKLSMLIVLLSVGAVVLARAPLSDDEFGKDDPLVWADVERHFARADRMNAKRAPRRSDPDRADRRHTEQGSAGGTEEDRTEAPLSRKDHPDDPPAPDGSSGGGRGP